MGLLKMAALWFVRVEGCKDHRRRDGGDALGLFYSEGEGCGASVGRGACEAMKPFRRRGEDEHAVASRGADRFGVQEPPERFGGCDFACARRHGLIGDAGHDAEDGVVGR